MTKKKPRLKVSFAIIPLILLIVVGINESYINETYGNRVFGYIMMSLFFTLLVFLLAPFLKILANTFGEKGYNTFWGKGKLAAGILKNGYSGTATLIGIDETDGGVITVNEQPVLTISLSIEIEKQEVYETSFDVLMPRAQLHQFTPGTSFPVKVDFQNKNHVVLDIDKLIEFQDPDTTGDELTEKNKKESKITRLISPFLFIILIALVVLLRNNDERLIEKFGETLFRQFSVALIILVALTAIGYTAKVVYNSFSNSYSVFYGKGGKAQRILKTGYMGEATLISLSETEEATITINEQPVLLMKLSIETPKSEVYKTSFNVLIHRTELPWFLPGKKFPVIIDPEDRNNVVLDIAKIHQLDNSNVRVGEFTDDDREVIKKTGKKAKAKLLNIEDTGKSVDFKSIVKFIYGIQIAGEQPYEIEFETPIKGKALLKQRSSVGKTFNAKVHPYDNNKVIIDLMI